ARPGSRLLWGGGRGHALFSAIRERALWPPPPPPADPPLSAWSSADALPPTRPLEGARRADVAIVGAGYTGLSAALHVAERGAEAVALDAAEPGWGGSGRNGGQIISRGKDDPDALERTFGSALGRRMLQKAGAGARPVFEGLSRHQNSLHAPQC